MTRSKTLSISLITALIASIVVHSSAQITFGTGSTKEYRQFRNKTTFRGGEFKTAFRDGSFVIGSCVLAEFSPPRPGSIFCPSGTSGFLIEGNLEDAEILESENANPFSPIGRYFEVASVTAASAVASNSAEKVQLLAAPASSLTRPSGGFEDRSSLVLFSLFSNQVREYPIVKYQKITKYSKSQADKFTSDIVPGVYAYSFPSLSDPEVPRTLRATILPMADSVREVNNQRQGFEFKSVNNNRLTKKGFVEMSVNKRNVIRWNGLTPGQVFPRADRLFISLRALENPKNPNSDIRRFSLSNLRSSQSIFPDFQSLNSSRVLIPNPFSTSYTIPATIASGTSAVLEIELDRGALDNGTGSDFSIRRFQVPVTFVDRFSEYKDVNFGQNRSTNRKNVKLLDDTDGDGYNNLTEWILGSSANTKASFPANPIPASVTPPRTFESLGNGFFTSTINQPYYGFNIRKKLGTVPPINYVLQRSKDKGVTWATFESDANWEITTENSQRSEAQANLNLPITSEIRVQAISRRIPEVPAAPATDTSPATPFQPARIERLLSQPPGTENDIYRVKITKAPK